MKYMNVRKIKNRGRRALALCCALVTMLPMMLHPTLATEVETPSEAGSGGTTSAETLAQAVNGQIALIKWTGFNYQNGPQGIPGGEYYVAMLMENGRMATGQGYDGGEYVPTTENWAPKTYSSNKFTYGDTFYSAGTHGASLFFLDRYYVTTTDANGNKKTVEERHTTAKYWDGDNDCYRLAWWVCDDEGNPVGAIGHDGSDLCCNYYLSDEVKKNNGTVDGIVHQKTYDQYLAAFDVNKVVGSVGEGTAAGGSAIEMTAPVWDGNSRAALKVDLNAYRTDYLAKTCMGKQPLLQWLDSYVLWWSLGESDRATCLFHNASNSRDVRVKFGNQKLWCNRDKDWWDACEFNMWKGEPKLYSCITQNYEIVDGQTLNLNAEEEALAGVYIPKGVTLTVKKGGTLSINETVFCDGKIVNDGGTVVIQSKGAVCPFAYDGTNDLTVKNNGVFIVMPEGRYFTPSVAVFAESRLVNFGVCAFGNNLQLYSSFVENRKGATLLMGYDFATTEGRPSFEAADLSQASKGKIKGMTEPKNTSGEKLYGKIYAYDTKGHYSTYGCFDNDGDMPGFNPGDGVKGDVIMTQIGGDTNGGSAMRELLVKEGYRTSSN